jgi:hypothetical protein
VGVESDKEASDVDEQFPTDATDLDGPLLPGASDLPRTKLATQARLPWRRTLQLALLDTRAVNINHRPWPSRPESSDDETADVRPRAARHANPGDTLYDLDDGRSSDTESPTPARLRRMPVADTRSVAATAAPETPTPAPACL